VTELPFREGQPVAAGATVVRLDDAALRSAVAAAEAALKAAETDLGRMEALLERNAATPREVDQARTQAAGAQAALSLARDNLAYAVLRAPFAGTIAARPVHVGDVVSPGETLIEIEGRGGLEVEATVGSELVASLRPGVEVQVRVDGHEEALTARVRSVSPAGDPATHRFGVEADLPRTPGLRSGLFARLVLPTPSESPRITVASEALFRRGGLTGVFVIDEGTARLRWVAPGAQAESTTEIRAGLEAGERVALDPTGLSDGAPVREAR
jgi:RND family efflux transporter MFP subunit